MEDFSGRWQAMRDFELRIIISCPDRGFPEAGWAGFGPILLFEELAK